MDPLKKQVTDDKALRLMRALDIIRKLDREVPGQVLTAFLYVASHNPCHKMAMEYELDFSSASASRVVDNLSEFHRLNRPGLGLVIKYEDPSNRRKVMIKLSPFGEAIINQMKEFLYGDNNLG